MIRSSLEPFFLDSKDGRIFCLLRAPQGVQRCVLFVPPFAEEMNKSRRQFSLTTEILMRKGFAVLLVDLFGTGDSEGEFREATWSAWTADLLSAIGWLDERSFSLDGIVAVRLGCALAAEALEARGRSVPRSAFWQPVESGEQFMTQFLRLRVAASMMVSDGKETVDGLKQRLANGETLEIAGYELSPALFRDIEAVNLIESLTPSLGDLALLEIGRARDDGGLSPAGQRFLKECRDRERPAIGRRMAGDPFWSATEIVVNSELGEVTASFLAGEAA